MSNTSALSGDLYHAGQSSVAGPSAVRVERPAWLGSAVAAFACFMAVMALLAGLWGRERGTTAPKAVAETPSSEPAPSWVDITRPLGTFALAGGPYAGLPMHLEAQRWTGGPARRDMLTYGTARPGEAFARLLFDRHEPGTSSDATLFVDAARLAATAGLAVVRSGLGSPLPTRFGAFDVAEVTIGLGSRAAPCQAFRRAGDLLTIVGLMCGAGSKPVAPTTLACAIDKIDLVAGGDAALTALFTAAERDRGLGCADPRAIHGQTDPLRPISNALRGTLGSQQGLGRQLSGLR